jgi:hypothetical protein
MPVLKQTAAPSLPEYAHAPCHREQPRRRSPQSVTHLRVKVVPGSVLLPDGPVRLQHCAVELEAAAKGQLPHTLAARHALGALNVGQLVPAGQHSQGP